MSARPSLVFYERTTPPTGFEDCQAFTCIEQAGPVGLIALRRTQRPSGTIRRDWLVFPPGHTQPVGRPAYSRREAWQRLSYRAAQSGMAKTPPPSRPKYADDPHTEAIVTLRLTGQHEAAQALTVATIAQHIDQLHAERVRAPVVLWEELAKMRTWCAAALQPTRDSHASNTDTAGDHHHGGPYPTGRPSLSIATDGSQNSPGARSSS